MDHTNTKRKHDSLMLDIETLGTKPGYVVWELAACRFNATTGEVGDTFSTVISVDDAKLQGLKIDPETVQWWEDHGGIHQDNALPLRETLECLVSFVDTSPPNKFWSWGIAFDFPLLEAAFDAVGINLPWRYWQVYDARTTWKLAFPERKRSEASHGALDDCIKQVESLSEAVAMLKLTL